MSSFTSHTAALSLAYHFHTTDSFGIINEKEHLQWEHCKYKFSYSNIFIIANALMFWLMYKDKNKNIMSMFWFMYKN